MAYTDPGGAFSSAFSDDLQQQAALRRQSMLDALHAQQVQQQMELGKESLEEKRLENRQKIRDQKETSVRKRIADMVPGDIPDESLLKDAQDAGVHLRTDSPEADLGTPPEAIAAPGLAAPGNTMPEGGGVLAKAPAGAIRFSGTPQQAKEAAQKKRVDEIVAKLPGMDPTSADFKRLATEYEMISGKSLPAALMAAPKTTGHSRYIFDPIKKQYFAAGDLATPLTADQIPKDAVVDRSAEPKDTSGAGDRRFDSAYEKAIAEISKRTQPLSGHVDAINDLGLMLNANSPEADRLIAPLVIKATISGQGSGFRMTQAEINQVLGARSKWENLKVALQQWSLDPTKALALSDTQRADMKTLIKAMRTKETKIMHSVDEARHQLDDAESAEAVHKIRTRIMGLLNTADDSENEEPAVKSGDTSAAAGAGGRTEYVIKDGKLVPKGQ